jgi:hypothetical protein
MTPDEAIKIVKTKANGRTRYEGQPAFVDEVLVGEIERLQARLKKYIDLYDDTLKQCQELAKEIFNKEVVEGDDILVPTISDLMEMAVNAVIIARGNQ